MVKQFPTIPFSLSDFLIRYKIVVWNFLLYNGKTAKSTIFYQKYVTCTTTNHQLPMQDSKNWVIRIDKKVSI